MAGLFLAAMPECGGLGVVGRILQLSRDAVDGRSVWQLVPSPCWGACPERVWSTHELAGFVGVVSAFAPGGLFCGGALFRGKSGSRWVGQLGERSLGTVSTAKGGKMGLLDRLLKREEFYQYRREAIPEDTGYCSDRECPCPGTPIPRGTGYLYISEEAVEFMRAKLSNHI